MVVFAFTCPYCGPITVVPMADIRTRRASPPSHWCPHCGTALSTTVDHDYEGPGSPA